MLDGKSVDPAEGMLLVQYLDDHEEPHDAPQPVDYDGCLAQVLAAGPKTKSKVGQVVITGHYASSAHVGGACLIRQDSVLGTLATG